MTSPREPRPGECWVHKWNGWHVRVSELVRADAGHVPVNGGSSGDGPLKFIGTGVWIGSFEPCTEHPPLPPGGAA